MKYLLIAGVLLFGLNYKAQSNKQNEIVEHFAKTPNGNWKIKKEIDENGNIIKYDSTFSYSSRGFNRVNSDSIFNSFFEEPKFDDFFLRDSAFFNTHYKRMDEIMNRFFFNEDF